jgi:hypothetical protein
MTKTKVAPLRAGRWRRHLVALSGSRTEPQTPFSTRSKPLTGTKHAMSHGPNTCKLTTMRRCTLESPTSGHRTGCSHGEPAVIVQTFCGM